MSCDKKFILISDWLILFIYVWSFGTVRYRNIGSVTFFVVHIFLTRLRMSCLRFSLGDCFAHFILSFLFDQIGNCLLLCTFLFWSRLEYFPMLTLDWDRVLLNNPTSREMLRCSRKRFLFSKSLCVFVWYAFDFNCIRFVFWKQSLHLRRVYRHKKYDPRRPLVTWYWHWAIKNRPHFVHTDST